MKAALFLSLLAVTLLQACDPGTDSDVPQAGVRVTLRELSIDQIAQVVLTAQPTGTTSTLSRDPSSQAFQGMLTLPEGAYVLSAAAYTADPNQGIVASGSANVTVTAGVISAVTLVLYDQTPEPGQQTLEPILKSFTASKLEPGVHEAITLSADVVHPAGAAITYAWSSTCPSGVFDAPSSATTSWTADTAGACTLTLTASVADKSVSASLEINVQPGAGGVNVSATYVPRPFISRLSMSHYSSGYTYSGLRERGAPGSSAAGNFAPVQAFKKFQVQITIYNSWTTVLQVSCNGTPSYVVTGTQVCGDTSCHANYSWTSPAPGAVCLLTATSSRSTPTGARVDTFSAGVWVQ
ncbi:hypothetical protein POL68_40845 [Stigmatella sp. ncwal1]|uniref:PKD domain-containing protein n=1 Tax=Stigmatella ashevillensis TaxID=2995309 RepID=A0ABT5DP10_9BACT|nr:hypothetical protein [Stigmatella ashevillena]MDC0714868.1 hypothetical protein [Stigmatella ashevillena]